ncbi:hypothetical protein G6F56_001457 [Rhizopus delemar]|nr:hypothetical protein G6F56_001457 [Rhizopus delemar]
MSKNIHTDQLNFTEQKISNNLEITRAIDVQLIDTNLYMSKELNQPMGSRGVYGGQIVAQALKSAWDTVPDEFFIHSLHAYFILACSAETPVIYHIQRIRDGSFAKPEQGVVLSHQSEMPLVVDPESLPTDLEILENALKKTSNPTKRFLNRIEARRKDAGVIENRIVNIEEPENVALGNVEPRNRDQRWFRTREKLNDDMKLHACSIAYASDAALLNASAVVHGMTFSSSSMGMMTSLDHTIWFYTPTRADEWLLYDKSSPRSYNGRGTSFGRIYNQDGILVATTAQEGVIRLSEKEKEKREQSDRELQSKL